MRNIIDHLTKSKTDKQAELISAYLDQALPARSQQQFEQALARDADLQAEVRQQQAIKMALQQLPRRRAPRSFTLDPARYAQRQPAPIWQPFPVLRAATAIMALLLVAVLAFDLGVVQRSSLSESVAMTQFEAESFALEEIVVTRTVAEESAAADTLQIAPEAAAAIVATEETMMAVTESDVAALEAEEDAALSQNAPESETEEGVVHGLGMARILTETVTPTAALPTLESAPPPALTAPPGTAAIAAAPDDAPSDAPTDAPSDDIESALAPDLAITPLPEAQPMPALSSRSLFLITEIFLVAAVLALALATWRARRRL